MDKNKSDGNSDNKISNETIVGINVIGSLVSKAVSNTSQILSGLKQILFFYRLLPDEWKKKAFWIFEKLWSKKLVIISTDPEQPEKIYGVTFDNDKLNNMFNLLPIADQAIILQGKSMVDLISRGLHGDSDEIKNNVEDRYGQRGLNIVNMLTTKDIQYLLDELAEQFNAKDCERKFNEWALQYDSIAVLVSPVDFKDLDKIKARIKNSSKNNIKNYTLVNLSGKMEDCTKLLQLVSDMKTCQELKYNEMAPDISESGFCKSLRIKISF